MVGAGVSGLIAARELVDAGVEVVILEGRDRVGGRLHTVDLAGAPVDLGAAWIHGARRNPLAALVDELGLATVEHDYALTRTWDAVEGRALTAAEQRAAEAHLGELARALPRLKASLGPTADLQRGIDAYLAARQLDPRADRYARFVLEQLLVELDYAGPTTRTSLSRFDEDEWFGPDDHLIAGGYRSLVTRLAEGLDVRLARTVTRVAWDDAGVRVEVGDGEAFTADRVIVTVPLGVLRRRSIEFVPGLPAAKLAAIDRLEMSSLEKLVLRYAEPFWDPGRFDAWAYLGRARGELPLIVDFSRHAGAPTLVLLHGGQRVRDVLDQRSDEQLVGEARAVVAAAIGVPGPEPIAAAVTRWRSDPFAWGSYSFPTLGSREDDPDRLAEPVAERVLFAGEATMAGHFATVHGALMSGLREARRLGATRDR